MEQENTFSPRFIRLATICLVNVYLVIIAGAVVRASDSGMGCPDWPKCFDSWVPPTEESQLPANYHEIYKDRGYEDTTFNAYHTWTEYINRLVGAVLGIFVFLLFVFSVKYFKQNKVVFWMSLLGFLLVGFQAWLGAKVVSSNLAPIKITIHMVTAMVIILIYSVILFKTKGYAGAYAEPIPVSAKILISVGLLLTLIQIAAGTQVREQIDTLNAAGYERYMWIKMLNIVYEFHRSFAIVVLAVNLYLYRIVIKNDSLSESVINRLSRNVLFFIFLEIFGGFILAYKNFPAFIQPLHLVIATGVFGLQSFMLLQLFVRNKTTTPEVSTN